ncbi:hypothetical protein [Halomonas sp. DQ26W]|uniref:hypothetical protein n=1 Tax=Halomonas sp. DQ26W TaxID=2282311 RepID=UPI0011C01847|nr:hypothetical protein [Halomonas sp. DQ26W]
MRKISKIYHFIIALGFHQSKYSNIRRSPLLLIRHDSDCGYRYRGRIYSQIIDSLADFALYHGIKSLSIASPFSRFSGASAHNDPLAFNRTFLRIALVSAILARVVGHSRALAYKREASIAVWERILNRAQPQVVIGIQPNRYLCAACKAVNISVYDYQHGVIAPDHWWYGNVLPKEIPYDELPSGILCWDRASAESLVSWAPKRAVQVRILGNPWFKRFEDRIPSDNLVNEALDLGVICNDGKPAILISLQWGLKEHYYYDTEFNNVMCEALVQVIKRTHQRYNWMLRLHPVQLHGVEGRETREFLRREFGQLEGVDWEEASRLPLPVVLKRTQLHITDMSTVVTESAWYGVPSAILNPFLRPGEKLETLFKEERKIGIASLVKQSVPDIEQWIVNALEAQQETHAVEPEESLLEFLRETVSVDDTLDDTNY